MLIALLFVLGMVTFLAGVFILIFRTGGNDVKNLAVQTAQIAQKSLAQDAAGLVGNTTVLVDSVNTLVASARGVGITLSILGMILMAGACFWALQIYQM